MTDQNNNNNNRGLTYTIVGVIALLLIGSVIYAMSNRNSSNSSSMSSNSSSASAMTAMSGGSTTVMVGGAAMYADKDIVTNVSNASNLTTLVAAVKAADLVSVLQSAGPFTVLGPNNDAFAKLPAGTVETLIKPENKAQLQNILKYHVISGKYLAKDLTDGLSLTTVQGDTLTVVRTGNDLSFRDTGGNLAKVQTADVLQSNGVAFVIDSVLTPKTNPTMTDAGNPTVGGAAMLKSKNLVENVTQASNLTTLVAAVKAAGLVETLQGPGPFTAFGPTNDAFAKLPAGTVETLVKPENKAQLTKILTYHVVSGKYLTSDLTDGQVLTTVQGGKLTIKKTGNQVMIMDESGGTSTIQTADVVQSNGVAHVIDTVLMPKS